MSSEGPNNETERLAALRSYQILDTVEESAYQDIVCLACYIAQTPIAMVSLVDADRQWFKARVGFESSQTGRDNAFCSHAIQNPDEPLIVPDATLDEHFAHNRFVVGEPHVRFYCGIPLLTDDGFALGSLCVIDRQPRQLSEEQLHALKALSRQVMAQLELRRHTLQLRGETAKLERVNDCLKIASLTDALTSLGNRAALNQELDQAVRRAQQNQAPLSLLLVDVDNFKHYNDTFGHAAGDSVLKRVGALMLSFARASDFAARYGGEEFVLLLPGTSTEGALSLGKRLCTLVEGADFPHGKVTLSVGAASLGPCIADAETLLESADQALYRAKQSGKNRVSVLA